MVVATRPFNRFIDWPRYRKTGTPLNKELREYVEEMNKAKGKVEPEKVGSSTEKDTPEMQAVHLRACHASSHEKDAGTPFVEEPETREAKDNYMQSDTVVKKGTAALEQDACFPSLQNSE